MAPAGTRDRGFGLAEVTDGDVLTDVQVEFGFSDGQHESPGNGRRAQMIFNRPLPALYTAHSWSLVSATAMLNNFAYS
ncbi:MAG: hypothetical protein WAM69_04895 [Candidatus Sulfotelmatobacter sp.]